MNGRNGSALYKLYLVAGVSLVAVGVVPHGSLSSWAFILPGAFLLAAGVLKAKQARRSRSERNRGSVFLSGVVLAAVAVAAAAAPFVFLALGQYANALITFATPLIALYTGFIAYVLIWDAVFGTQPPYAKEVGDWVARTVRRGSQSR